MVACRGVYDALARSSSSCLGLKDKKSGLEALALKERPVECGTVIHWCQCAAQLGDWAQKTLTQHVLLGNCSYVVVFAGNECTIPNLSLHETVQNVDLTFWKNLVKTS